MIHLELINDQDLQVPDVALFQSWANQVANQLKTSGEVCIKIVDATESQSLNCQYRGKDQPTNVLSFPAEIPDFVESEQLGDLAICAEVVVREAAEQNKAVEHHWAHMTIHGLLHLLGYDHLEDDEAEAMEALEIQLLSALDIPNPYQ